MGFFYKKKIKMDESIKKYYNEYCIKKSDINEHLPTLFKYASSCDHITEMGVRSGVSTVAFLQAKPKILISIDIIKHKNINNLEKQSKTENINFNFILGNTLKIKIEETELLFIDTLHTYDQLSKELKLHVDKVKKYIILHDTSSFEFEDEKRRGYIPSSTGKKGLWPAVEEFLDKNNNWSIKERFKNNNGLTILQKELK
jgi:hypothetical protein